MKTNRLGELQPGELTLLDKFAQGLMRSAFNAGDKNCPALSQNEFTEYIDGAANEAYESAEAMILARRQLLNLE